jgi:hypothetical protein
LTLPLFIITLAPAIIAIIIIIITLYTCRHYMHSLLYAIITPLLLLLLDTMPHYIIIIIINIILRFATLDFIIIFTLLIISFAITHYFHSHYSTLRHYAINIKTLFSHYCHIIITYWRRHFFTLFRHYWYFAIIYAIIIFSFIISLLLSPHYFTLRHITH